MNDSRQLVGQLVLGRYRVVRELAHGGMGIVYLGRTEGAAGFTKPVVVKRILPSLTDQEESAALFVREARILSHLQHSGIVSIIDFGQSDSAYLMLLEYVHGYNLSQWLRYTVGRGSKFPINIAIHIMIRVLDALHYAQSSIGADGRPLGIIHRDISPGNILIDAHGNVKLADFGVARMTDETDEFKTKQGIFKGKVPFIAPEIFLGKPASIQSDVYACGLVLYQLLAGRNPFTTGDMGSTLMRVVSHQPPPIGSIREGVPPLIEKHIMRATSKEPTERFETAAQFADALRNARRLSDEESSAELSKRVLVDFNGVMPLKLKLEPLNIRDAAWREEQNTCPSHQVPLDSSQRIPLALPGTPSPPNPTKIAEPVKRSPARGAARKWAPFAAISLCALVGLQWIALDRRPTVDTRFVVVENTADDIETETALDSEQDPQGTSTANAPSKSPPERKAKPTSSKKKRAPAKSGPDARKLSRTFAKRHSRIESCFSRDTTELSRRPKLSVHFTIDTMGKVVDAQLSPRALAKTSSGKCILQIARGTRFGPQTKGVTFAIPITARVK